MPVTTSESILNSVKKTLGVPPELDEFDVDILMHINSVFAKLQDLGVGPPDGFEIEDETATWASYTSDAKKMNLVKSYIFVRVRLLFDITSMTSYVITSFENLAKEYEFRLNVMSDKLLYPLPAEEVDDE